MSAGAVMFGTRAIHQLGDISRDNGDFFAVTGEDDENWIGHWLTGFGFINVKFPKASSRPIRADERAWLDQHPVVLM